MQLKNILTLALRNLKQQVIVNNLRQMCFLLSKVFWLPTHLIPPVVKVEAGTSRELPSAGPCQHTAEDLCYSTIQ